MVVWCLGLDVVALDSSDAGSSCMYAVNSALPSSSIHAISPGMRTRTNTLTASPSGLSGLLRDHHVTAQTRARCVI